MAKYKDQPLDTPELGSTILGSGPAGESENYSVQDIADVISESVDGLSQDNVNVLITVDAVSTDVSEAINAYTVEGEPLIISDKQSLLVKALFETNSGSEVTLETKYYHIIGLGKGVYGLGGTVNVEEENLLEFRTENNINLPSTTGNTPIVYSISSSDLDDPEFTVNNEDEDYLIEVGTDYYFKIYNPIGLSNVLNTINNFTLYRFVGSAGTYGLGNTATVTADFEEVNSLDFANKITGRKYVVPVVVNSPNSFLASGVVTNVAEAVQAAYANSVINISDKELVTFQVKRYSNGSIIEEKYHWNRGERENVQNNCTVNDFEYYNREVIASLTSIPSTPTAPLTIDSIYGDDTLAPATNLNNNTSPIVVTNTEPQYFLSTTLNSRNPETALYLFTGSAGTYGNGQADTAVSSDFTLVEYNNENSSINTLPQAFLDVQNNVIDLRNHEIIFYNQKTPYTGNLLKIGAKKLGGEAEVLIDTTGKTEFPIIETNYSITVVGTNGAGTITIDGTDYTITFNTDEDGTVASFITDEAANILAAEGVTITADSDIIEFAKDTYFEVSFANTSGDLAGGFNENNPVQLIKPIDFQADKQYQMKVRYNGVITHYWFKSFEFITNNGNSVLVSKTGDTITFIEDSEYNALAPSSATEITLDFTEAVAGTVQVFHSNAVSKPFFDNTNVKSIKGSYVLNKLNSIYYFFNTEGEVLINIVNGALEALNQTSYNLVLINNTEVQVNISNDLNAQRYDILYGTTADINNAIVAVGYDNTSLTHNITGLTADTEYHIFVRSRSSYFLSSDYSIQTITTTVVSNLLLNERFTGTTLNTANGTIQNDNSADYTITQNNKLLFTRITDNTAGGDGTDNWKSVNAFGKGSAFTFLMNRDIGYVNGFVRVMWNFANGSYITFVKNSNTTTITITIVQNTNVVYNQIVTPSPDNRFLITYEDNNDIKFWYWNSNIWTVLGTAQNFDLGAVSPSGFIRIHALSKNTDAIGDILSFDDVIVNDGMWDINQELPPNA